MIDYMRCYACHTPLDVETYESGGYNGVGWELALQEFTGSGTEDTLDAMHDGYLCPACAEFMWSALMTHIAQKGNV